MVNLHTFCRQCRLMTGAKNTVATNFYLPIIYFMLTDSRLNKPNEPIIDHYCESYDNTSQDIPISPFGPVLDERLDKNYML